MRVQSPGFDRGGPSSWDDVEQTQIQAALSMVSRKNKKTVGYQVAAINRKWITSSFSLFLVLTAIQQLRYPLLSTRDFPVYSVHVVQPEQPLSINLQHPADLTSDSLSSQQGKSRPPPLKRPSLETMRSTDSNGGALPKQKKWPQPLPKELPPANVSDAELARRLGFSNRTTLNFFHLHKVGGMTYKNLLFESLWNAKRGDGRLLSFADTCVKVEGRVLCSDRQFWQRRSAEQIALFDVVAGHQYIRNGVKEHLPNRDVRPFTVLRHPFVRKLSHYYHFFVRNEGRREDNVTTTELIRYLTTSKFGYTCQYCMGVGPNYYAGQMLADGPDDFVQRDHRMFDVPPQRVNATLEAASSLLSDMLFVGLQNEVPASLCMLRRTVVGFQEAHGIVQQDSFPSFSVSRKDNAGSYKLGAKELWQAMSEQQRRDYEAHERVDLAIYEQAAKLFYGSTRKFGCEHLVRGAVQHL